MKEIIIKVKGMVCEGGENRIKNILATIDGIESVEANHKTGTVIIMSDGKIKRTLIEERINELGFETKKED